MGSPMQDTVEWQAVAEVAVCPRTTQRVAVRLHGGSHVLIFQRSGAEAWSRQDLSLRGLVGTSVSSTDCADAGGLPPRPCALAFAGNASRRTQGTQGNDFFEGSLLAVYWDFGARGAEVRTYPMHFLPYKVMQNDMS